MPYILRGGNEAASEQAHATAWCAHCFGACPVAASVVMELRSALPASVLVECTDVGLLHSPAGSGLQDGAWGLCVAALAAMDVGRRAHMAMAVKASGPGVVLSNDQTFITDFTPCHHQSECSRFAGFDHH